MTLAGVLYYANDIRFFHYHIRVHKGFHFLDSQR